MSNTDLVCRSPRLPRAGETVAGTSYDTFAGGKGANQAVAAARAGADVMFCGATGDDANGQDRRRDLEAEGVDVAAVQVVDGIASGVALIVVDDTGENQIVTVAGANAHVDAQAALSGVLEYDPDLLLMTWELEPETSAAILAGVSGSLPVVLNCAPYSESIRALFPDPRLIVICNEVEASQLLGAEVSTSDAESGAMAIFNLGCKAAIITIGAQGAVGADQNGTWTVHPPDVDVIDTTGAGDTFCGAFAAWLARGASLREATVAGTHAGSLATTKRGAQPSIPRLDAILSSIESD